MRRRRQPVHTLDDYERLVKSARPGEILTVYLYKSASGQRRLSTVRVDER